PGIPLSLQFDTLAPLDLAILLQQLASPQHTIACRCYLVFWNHPFDDAKALHSQRVDISLDLRVASVGDASADGVGYAEALVEMCLFGHVLPGFVIWVAVMLVWVINTR
ncbi:MAG: hypothetical protein CL731_08945, partial [Chloroflexi bacterium]|nr:hypothetical protein [Chloroflexota bacterium]